MRKKEEAVKISQSQRFIETARAIGCDESEDAFKERLGKLLSAPVPPKDAPPRGLGKASKGSRDRKATGGE
jgi:hypothetical protein